jgi:hypothetical protein
VLGDEAPRLELEPPLERLALLEAPSPLRLTLGAEPPPGKRHRHSFLIPAVEVPLAALVLNLSDRLLDKPYSQTNGFVPFWHNLVHEPWQLDDDDLRANFIAHPYNGNIYFNLARTSGLGFWWSTAYAAVGSALFELGGETQPPSINDEVITTVGGSIAGEILYRSSVRILEGGDGAPGFWRYLPAFLLNPPLIFNRLIFGEYRTPEYDERAPIYFMAGGSGGYNWTTNPLDGGDSQGWAGGGQFEYRYGQPADPAFSPGRPFQFFRVTAALGGDHEALRDAFTLQGLLGGWKFDDHRFHGVGGFFASYDNVSGGVFRVAGATAGVGVTGQAQLSDAVALELTSVASMVILGAVDTTVIVPPHAYHLGPGVELELESRLYLGARTMGSLAVNQFLLSGTHALPGREAVTYGRSQVWWRFAGPFSLGASATLAVRNAVAPNEPPINQVVITPSVNLAWMSDLRFGAWVPPAEGVAPR